MNAKAPEWVPYIEDTITQSTINSLLDDNQDVDISQAQELPEIDANLLWPNNTVSAAIEDNLSGYLSSEVASGMQWAAGSVSVPAPQRRSLQSMGLSEQVRAHFATLDLATLRQMDPDDERYNDIPTKYQSAYPLDDPSKQRELLQQHQHLLETGNGAGQLGAIYKVVDRTDGQTYALKRYDNVRTTPSVLAQCCARWSQVRHPSLVSLHSAFQDKGAVFFCHSFHPGAQTLKERYLDQQGGYLPEALLWRILVQLLGALRFLHARNLSARACGPSNIIVTSGSRVRYNYVSACVRLAVVYYLSICK